MLLLLKKNILCSYLSLIHAFNVRGRQVSIDFIDVLLVHVFRHRIFIQMVHWIGAW